MEIQHKRCTASVTQYRENGKVAATYSMTGDVEVYGISQSFFHEFMMKYILNLTSKLLQVIITIISEEFDQTEKVTCNSKTSLFIRVCVKSSLQKHFQNKPLHFVERDLPIKFIAPTLFFAAWNYILSHVDATISKCKPYNIFVF